MTVHASSLRRLLLAGSFAVAVAAVPVVSAVVGAPSAPMASCPPGQTLDVMTGTCAPDVQAPEPITNPINPENAQLQPGSITSSEPGEVGRLPEVNGIPCTGDNTGLCIGLTEVNQNLGIAGG